MRLVAALHYLALALLTGGIAGVALCVNVLFQRAPSREVAGQVGNVIFGRLGPAVLALAAIVLATSILLHRGEAPSAARTAALVLGVAAFALSVLVALWLTPGMSGIWRSGAHAADGSGLIGDDRRRFLALHIGANLTYMGILVLSAGLIALRALKSLTR